MKKTIEDYFESKQQEKLILVQVRIPESLHKEMSDYIEKVGENWQRLLKACILRVKEEIEEKK